MYVKFFTLKFLIVYFLFYFKFLFPEILKISKGKHFIPVGKITQKAVWVYFWQYGTVFLVPN